MRVTKPTGFVGRSESPRTPVRFALALALLIASSLVPLMATSSAAAIAPADCSALNTPIYHRINPTSGANLLTPYQNEATQAGTKYGFTEDKGAPFQAAGQVTSDLVPVHRLFNASTENFVWMAEADEIAGATTRYGYVDQGINFFAASSTNDCLVPIHRLRKGDIHRHALDVDRAGLVAAGWVYEKVAFYAAPASAPTPTPTPTPNPTPPPTPATDTKFSIAVYPDTQNEVFGTDTRFINRTNWLVANKQNLDLRFVTHSGDMANWDTPDHNQYVIASNAMKPLETAGVPYSIAIGNHDAAATCPGGSACPGQSASVGLRNTTTFNQFFPASRFAALRGQYEAGKVDNHYSTFNAGGKQWMVLVLELWPRPGAVAWAKAVVAEHPAHNVLVVTHAYLEGDGSIGGSNGGYGATSPRYLFDELIKPYPNVRMTFSGHVGIAGGREDTGAGGNKIASILGTFHSGTTNPVQIVEIDTAAETVSSRFFAPYTGESYPQYSRTVTGMDWVG